jgi:pimeloyl-ACP methyl ester carboxylesterase
LAYYDVLSDDGTMLRAWTNDPDRVINGPTIVLCNGLGTTAWSWPALLSPACGVRVVSWNHRGTGGSQRPRDASDVGVDRFVQDALSVMDHFGVTKSVLVGWSIGVNTMFELAAAHPERVSGLFAVAGVPGDVFSGVLGPLGLPAAMSRRLSRTWSHSLRLVGPALSPLTRRVPVGRWTVHALGRTGLIGSMPDPDLAALALSQFLSTPVEWYFHLALRSADHRYASLRRIRVPVQFVGGTFDLLSSSRRMAEAAAKISDAQVVELRASHFIPLEHPERVHQLLLYFLDRVSAHASPRA